MWSVLLRLEGPLQSWGTQGRFGHRDTDREPSKSGVLGLVGAALGMARSDRGMLERLRALRMAVRVDREGVLVSDYHTVGAGTFNGEPHRIWSENGNADPAVTQRHYISDASFLVALGGSRELVETIATALKNPVWPLFLGRRACPPSRPVFEGVLEADPEDAIRQWPLAGVTTTPVRLVVESDPQTGSPRDDDPESFELYERSHARRYVRFEYLDPPAVAPSDPVKEQP